MDRVDVYQGKRGSKVHIDIVNFDFGASTEGGAIIMIFEGTPSFPDARNMLSSTPGCFGTRKPRKKNKKQLKREKLKLAHRMKQNQKETGVEILDVSLMHNKYVIRSSR